MKRVMLPGSLLSAAFIWAGLPHLGPPVRQASPEDDIRSVVELYFAGIDRHDRDALERAFHPDAQLQANLGRYWERSFSEWARFAEQPVPANAADRVNRIVSIDVEGSAAVVKTELVWPDIRYVDYLSLLFVDGSWRITNKIWHQEPREREVRWRS